MAINIFRNISRNLLLAGEEVYITPPGYSAIVLMAQVSNTTNTPATVSLGVLDTDSTYTSLLTSFTIPGYDAAGTLSGKLVLQSGQGMFASASDSTSLTIVLSILESQN